MAASGRRIAVVLFNMGGPDSLKAVRPFLFNLFRDRAILQLPAAGRYPLAALIAAGRAKSARANYAHMGGSSPLLKETRAQAEALEAALKRQVPSAEVRVFIAMRYWRPLTQETAAEVEAFAPDELVLLPLYPQYSTTTTASSLQAWGQAYRGPGRVHAVCCWRELPGLIEAHAARIRACWDAAGRPDNVRLLFSAHGLPQRCVDAGDPYQWQVEATCRAVLQRLDWPGEWRICYQSRVGPLKWLGPYTTDAIAEACRDGVGVLIDPVAFVSEHVETLVELDRDYAALARRQGCSLYLRAAAVGTEPALIEGLAGLVAQALDRPGLMPDGEVCSARWGKCPMQHEQEDLPSPLEGEGSREGGHADASRATLNKKFGRAGAAPLPRPLPLEGGGEIAKSARGVCFSHCLAGKPA
jgi:ferrochelatase